jgi:16S rRNA (cytidine1402-2'-O)-methyltransferase
VIGPGVEGGAPDIAFAVDALRGLVRAGARPRAAASVVSALTGVPANELYRGITGRDPRR